MKIIHMLPNVNVRVTESFIQFISENFESDKHYFKLVTKNSVIDLNLNKLKNVEMIPNLSTKDMLNTCSEYDKVIIHYLNFKTIEIFKLLFHPQIFEKIIWVAWGADLYQWKEKIEGSLSRRVSLLARNFIAKSFRRRIKYFVGIFPPDIKYFKDEFQTNSKTFYASYVGNLYNPLYKNKQDFDDLEYKITHDKTINIQIGHSSTKILNHLESLQDLKKYKNENIKIYLPLNYGDMNYGDIVESEANKIFGGKVECIREMMSKEEYMQYLSTIDIAIFNTTRQIGLGNISPMLYMNKKMFMPKDSVMYNFYRSQNIDIWDYNKIKNLSFHEFIKPLNYKNGTKYIAENELNLEHKIEMWNKVFKA
ncbi:hypothetical protein RU93_GL000643 [Enterococcus aquimarinus]|uniref:4-alpha-L-fucosyltransferase n=2 Tax=Enterococcus aquimarinus TaxID=328396 RepID=A0A1L8QQ94_9ENTE|nr:hypothetical protein RU93_GL000643 [Enterococcus aquimarinus]